MRAPLRLAALLAAACLVAPAVSGCTASASAASGSIAVTGFTRVDPVVVAAPALARPALDVTIGIAKLQTPALIMARRKAASGPRPRGPVVAGVLREVRVRPGDAVKKGQIVAVFDDRMLRLGVDSAQAAYRKALAAADTMNATADDLRTQRAEVRTARRTLLDQQELLSTGSTKLEGQLAQLKAQIPQLETAAAGLSGARAGLAAKLAHAEKLAASPTPPPGIAAVVAQLKGALAQVDGKAATVHAALAKLRAAVPQLTAVLAKMAAGSAAMAGAKTQIASALSQMADGISQLDNAGSVLRTAAGAQSTGVAIARRDLKEATVLSPVDGLVLSARPSGQTVIVGAPIAVIRPRGEVLVDVYLSPAQVSRVKVGDRAQVTVDSIAGTVAGRVSSIASVVSFPPANYPTPIVHLADTVQVTVAVPATRIPVGVPADVVIQPSTF